MKNVFKFISLIVFLAASTNIAALPSALVVQFDREPTVTESDLKIVDMTIALLADEAAWDREDDGNCAEDEERKKRSLYCALVYASVSVTGEYNRNSVAVEIVKSAVLRQTAMRRFRYILLDYNNLSETSHKDLMIVLNESKERVQELLLAPTNPGRPET